MSTTPPTHLSETERLHRLLEAGRALVAELDLDTVLDQVLETARALTGARYAALGILDDTRTELEQFITRGIDRDQREVIGDLPHGRGVLGLLIEDPRPLRLDDVTEHPESYGFPPGHPPMGTFLGVPIVIRGQAWGNLYLTEKAGGESFDDGDEHTAVTLSAWAAVAIENARLYEGAERRRQELERAIRGLEATTAIARAVGGETRLERILELIVKRGRALVDAQRVVIGLAQGEELVIAARAGDQGYAEMPTTVLQEVLKNGKPRRDEHALFVPLHFRSRLLGVLVASGRMTGSRPFDADDEQLLTSFAASASTAVATAQSVERDRLRHALRASEEERRRWARELHDETLQGLGALRVGLAAAVREPDPEELRRHVRQAVEHIAGEVDNLRAIITDLRPAALDQLGLEPALEALGHRVASTQGLAVEQRFALRPLDPDIETTVYRLVQEALTNVSKHARAARVWLDVTASTDTVEVVVRDDGTGFDPEAATGGFGLQGMRERVALAGGTMDLASAPDGTTVRITVPASYDSPLPPINP
jgi:signal transduction histidine kinase